MDIQKQYIENNSNLAFKLAVKMMRDYALKCEVDEEKEIMDPLLGSYLLLHELSIGLFYKAEGYEEELTNILIDAINDAKHVVQNTRETHDA